MAASNKAQTVLVTTTAFVRNEPLAIVHVGFHL